MDLSFELHIKELFDNEYTVVAVILCFILPGGQTLFEKHSSISIDTD